MAVDHALRTGVPGYVGLSFDAEGQLRLALAGGSDAAAASKLARDVWASTLAERHAQGQGRLRVQTILAQLGPQDLTAAMTAMRDVLTLAKTVFLDLDETCGCITVGISDATAEAAVMAFAAQRGLQQGAVRTVLTAPIVRTLGLRDRFRPTLGGIEITAAGSCTLGLPVYHFGQSRAGFLTASHCTARQGGVDATVFFQEGTSAGGITVGTPPEPRPIGNETVDPAMFNQTTDAACPTGRSCRYSDVAFATEAELNMVRIGRIARPSTACDATVTTCSLTVARTTDDIRVTVASTGAFVGDTMHKIGRTTGWTSGAVNSTCANANVVNPDLSDAGITLLCQYFVSAATSPGDSGSPVFRFNAATGTASMEGILWGGAASGANNFFVYAPISGIQRELGPIVYNQQGVAPPFFSPGRFYTSDFADDLAVAVEPNAVPTDRVEFVLTAGLGLHGRKEVVLAEGTNPPAAGNGRWTLSVANNGSTQRDGLFLYQLPGGHLEFLKQGPGNQMVEVSRIPIDSIAPGTRISFTWERD